jgi:hypothetical protein
MPKVSTSSKWQLTAINKNPENNKKSHEKNRDKRWDFILKKNNDVCQFTTR